MRIHHNIRPSHRWASVMAWLGTSAVVVTTVAFVDPFVAVTITKIAIAVFWFRSFLRNA